MEHGVIKPTLRSIWPWRCRTFGGVRVHFKKDLDGGGSGFGQEYISYLRNRGMPRQHRVFEWCAGPGFIGFSMLGNGLAETLCVADINPAAVAACRRTIKDNGLGERAVVYLSDNLADIPVSEKWDLVVSNPPHFVDDFHGELRGHDPDWRIHREFFAGVRHYLKPGGMLIIQENNRGSTIETFRGMIEEAGLHVVFVDYCEPQRTADDRFYYIGIMRKGETPPAWAQSRV